MINERNIISKIARKLYQDNSVLINLLLKTIEEQEGKIKYLEDKSWSNNFIIEKIYDNRIDNNLN